MLSLGRGKGRGGEAVIRHVGFNVLESRIQFLGLVVV